MKENIWTPQKKEKVCSVQEFIVYNSTSSLSIISLIPEGKIWTIVHNFFQTMMRPCPQTYIVATTDVILLRAATCSSSPPYRNRQASAMRLISKGALQVYSLLIYPIVTCIHLDGNQRDQSASLYAS